MPQFKPGFFEFPILFPRRPEENTDKNLTQVYMLADGRKFGSWIDADSRNQGYNENGLIENPVFIIESILRDELGLASASINYASFDDLGDATAGRRDNWLFARSLTQQRNSLAVIDEICKEGALVTIHDYANKERVVALDHYNPANQLTNADIVFEGKPLVRVRQTHVKYIYNEFFLNYDLNYATGNYDKQLYITATANNLSSNTRNDKTYALYGSAGGLCEGSQTMYNVVRRWTYDANWIKDDATAELFIKTMADWLAIRKWEIEATLWYSEKTLKLEAFDQVTWNLDLLPASVRDVQIGDLAGSDDTGGSLADDTYYYVVTGVDSYGESKQSNEAEVEVSGHGGSGMVLLSWTALPDAVSYRIYRGTSSGEQDTYYTSATNSFTDIGASGTAGTPATAASAFFITNVIDYGLRGGGRVRMKFMLCPYIYF